MPIRWNSDIAANYWQSWHFTLLHPGVNATIRIADNIQRIHRRQELYDQSMALVQLTCTDDGITPSFTQKSLELWVKTLSWSFCEDCGSLMFQKLLPSSNKNKKCNNTVKCHCKENKCILPQVTAIPAVLVRLQEHHVRALCPFDIHTSPYE